MCYRAAYFITRASRREIAKEQKEEDVEMRNLDNVARSQTFIKWRVHNRMGTVNAATLITHQEV